MLRQRGLQRYVDAAAAFFQNAALLPAALRRIVQLDRRLRYRMENAGKRDARQRYDGSQKQNDDQHARGFKTGPCLQRYAEQRAAQA